MQNDGVIRAEHLSKKFCRSLKYVMTYGAVDTVRDFFDFKSQTENLRKGEFWAVDDVDFEAKKGETLGIIGPNGSGKSTILKMLNGIYMPDKGQIQLKGWTGGLIEVGAGFHPMLTGRENIYVNGSILGLKKKEIDRKFDEIVDFADIGDFIDSPVKHYSSGMYVRLGFSIAVHVEPEILLVDEVLAVGDANFWSKSVNRMRQLRTRGMTIVLVTHNMWLVESFCDRAILLDRGHIRAQGAPLDVIGVYRGLSKAFPDAENQSRVTLPGNRCEQITNFQVLPRDDWRTEKEALPDSGVRVVIAAQINGFPRVKFLIRITSLDGFPYFTVYSKHADVPKNGRLECEAVIPKLMLLAGEYLIWGAVCSEKGEDEILAAESTHISVKGGDEVSRRFGFFWNKAYWQIRS